MPAMRWWLAPAMAGGILVLSQSSQAATVQEDFSTNPAAQGWKVFGQASLFSWNSAGQNLEVTWDSSQPNSYFYHPLGTALGRDDDFIVSFDLRLQDITPGANTNKSGAFELAISLLNLPQATSTNFLRGTGSDSPNLVEFDYFADAGFGATIWPTFISTNSVFNYSGPADYTALALSVGDTFHVVMSYTASNATLATSMTRNGGAFGPIHSVVLSTNFTDFRVDTFAISSYSDTGDDFDSLLAHGTVDNLTITTPPPPLTDVTGAFAAGHAWEVHFVGSTNWLYTLERSIDFNTWTPASSTVSGSGAPQVLQDAASPANKAFYRVRADRP